ncbi:DeoR/GlpR family DNA-binding transcription regulator [uncultured Metabacillus sp.]|uniref:DeoR/GlpR family DNA-binding transcription regulator n=1 Tax=uncultured Metabacillus sp. TaxID=2860135 RepID=UPI00260B71F3|nr:DeoR/GlpR family DNA-binding transcription regulator [uncultured Metabacillus sp.]
MLISERHRLILELLKEKGNVTVHELVEVTNSSESTLRRDLDQLEKEHYLKRVHGGASLLQRKREEPSMVEKSTQNLKEKNNLAKYAVQRIEEGDCVYLDAGTTTYQMIQHLDKKNIVVVTNGIDHLDALLEKDINTYIIGGYVKKVTRAMIGSNAYESIQHYRFDKCFIGTNGIHHKLGFTTPDPEEAQLKAKAIQLSREPFVLADHTKFGEVSFSKFADLHQAKIITNEEDSMMLEKYKEKTDIYIAAFL